MVKKIGIAFAVLALLVVVLFFVLTQGPDLSQYEPLKDPRLTTMKDQKMVVKGPGMFFKGNPEKYYTIIRYQVEKAGASRVQGS